jgi:hypothetical protein
MYKPTSLVVIAWFWVIGGGTSFVSAIPALVSALTMGNELGARGVSAEGQQFLWGPILLFSAIILVGMACAAAGAVFGVGLLQLREWGRKGLVVMTATLLLCIVGFFLFFLSSSAGAIQHGHDVFFWVPLVGIVVFGSPVLFMLNALRSSAFRNAIWVGNSIRAKVSAVGDAPPGIKHLTHINR